MSITASEARVKAEEILKGVLEKQISKIDSLIESNLAEGTISILISNDTLVLRIITYYKSLGYSVGEKEIEYFTKMAAKFITLKW